MKRYQVLFVTSRFPFPAIGGGLIRGFNLIQQLNKKFEVTLVSLGNPSELEIDSLRAATGVSNIYCVPHSRTKAYMGSAKALFNGSPLQVGYYESSELNQLVQKLSANVDACIFHLIRTSSAWKNKPNLPAVLEMCDAISANYEQTSKEGPWLSPWRIISAIEGKRVAVFELKEALRFDLISLHTQRDANKIGVDPAKILISTQGTDLSGIAYLGPEQRKECKIALIGRMDFFPNWHGAVWFAKNVLPLLPIEFKLKIVGDCSMKLRRLLESIDKVEVTGRVARLDLACTDCIAAIAPMHIATGIQNKVLEYFAMGLPSVISQSVASGLLPAAEGGYLVADTADQWAKAIRTICSDLITASTMTQHARKYVSSSHDWDVIGNLYNEKLLTLIESKRLTA